MDHYTEYSVGLKKSKIAIAVVQLTGPLPKGKHKTVINDRETLGWRSLEEMTSRVEKACSILDRLAKVTVKPDVVVFPEYSLPVQKSLSILQKKADDLGFIIVGGADTIWQSDSADILNQAPIFVPHRARPIWATKRIVSQWEEGLVDVPKKIDQPLLTWSVGRQKYWMSTHICLDFSLAYEEFKKGGGLFLVPMCSPDVMSFLGWADGLLRLDGGSATVLCNCVGEGAKGQSGVVAMDPGAKPFQAAIELSSTKEQVSVFEIELERLSPPKKTKLHQIYPLGQRYIYDIEILNEGIQLREIPAEDKGIKKRGVINPSIFHDVLGKKLRMAFLNVPQYAEVKNSVEGKDYEVLGVLGREDLMVTHLAADRYDMIFDVTQAISWIGIKGDTVTPQNLDAVDEDNFPHFRVDSYFKVLGMPVNESDRTVFTSRNSPFPGFPEIEKIFKLGQSWEATDVSDEERVRFLENRWILGTTQASPGDINAVMTIRLQFAKNENKLHLLQKFEQEVIPDLMRNSQVTSLYRGVSPGMGVDYVLRLSIELDKGFSRLYDLIERVHTLSIAERLLVDTTTYIVVSSLSRLSLPRAVLVTNLPREFKRYRDQRISPYLSYEERIKLIYQSEKDQLSFINQFRPLDDALEEIKYLNLEADEKKVFLRRLTRGLFTKNFDDLKQVHDPLQVKVEKTLTDFIKNEIRDNDFTSLKEKESIKSEKTASQLYYQEKIKIAARHIEETDKRRNCLTATQSLSSTIKARNAITHNDWDRLTLEDFVAAIVQYCGFILSWESGYEESRRTD